MRRPAARGQVLSPVAHCRAWPSWPLAQAGVENGAKPQYQITQQVQSQRTAASLHSSPQAATAKTLASRGRSMG